MVIIGYDVTEAPKCTFVTLMAPGSGVQVQGRDKYGHIVKMHKKSSTVVRYKLNA